MSSQNLSGLQALKKPVSQAVFEITKKFSLCSQSHSITRWSCSVTPLLYSFCKRYSRASGVFQVQLPLALNAHTPVTMRDPSS